MKLTAREVTMAVLAAAIWGMGFVIAKPAVGHFPPILLTAFRFLLTAGVLVWFVPVPRGNMRALFWIALVSAAIQFSLTFTGLKGLSAGLSALIVQLEVPFLVLLGAVMLKERPTARKWTGILVSFLGVLLIVEELRFDGQWISVAMVVGGAFTWALGQVMVRQLRDIDGMTVTAWIAVFATPQLFIMSALFEPHPLAAIEAADWQVWAAIAYLGLIMTALGYFLWNTLIRAHDVGQVAPFLLLLPLFSVLGGALFLGEALGLSQLFGGAIVLAGVALVTLERWPRRRGAPVDQGLAPLGR